MGVNLLENNRFRASHCDIATIAASCFSKLTAVTVMDLSKNKLQKLPTEFALCKSLLVLDVSENLLSSTDVLSSLKSLQQLNIRGNAKLVVCAHESDLPKGSSTYTLVHSLPDLKSLNDEVAACVFPHPAASHRHPHAVPVTVAQGPQRGSPVLPPDARCSWCGRPRTTRRSGSGQRWRTSRSCWSRQLRSVPATYASRAGVSQGPPRQCRHSAPVPRVPGGRSPARSRRSGTGRT